MDARVFMDGWMDARVLRAMVFSSVPIAKLVCHSLLFSSLDPSMESTQSGTLKRSSDKAELPVSLSPTEAKQPRLDSEDNKKPLAEWVLFQVCGEDDEQMGYYALDRTSTPHCRGYYQDHQGMAHGGSRQ